MYINTAIIWCVCGRYDACNTYADTLACKQCMLSAKHIQFNMNLGELVYLMWCGVGFVVLYSLKCGALASISSMVVKRK